MWHVAVVVALVLWAAYLLVPADWMVARHIIIYPAADLAAAVAVLYGVRLYRPRWPSAWRLIAGGVFSFAVADLIYGVHQVAGTEPFPSAADVFYLAAY